MKTMEGSAYGKRGTQVRESVRARVKVRTYVCMRQNQQAAAKVPAWQSACAVQPKQTIGVQRRSASSSARQRKGSAKRASPTPFCRACYGSRRQAGKPELKAGRFAGGNNTEWRRAVVHRSARRRSSGYVAAALVCRASAALRRQIKGTPRRHAQPRAKCRASRVK